MPAKIIGLTGPSAFTHDCINMIEECLKANLVMLNQNRIENVQVWLDRCDGVIIGGGIDMHPSLYGQGIQAGMSLTKFDYQRDQKELLIIDYCFQVAKPMMGICRGHQLLGVYKGFGNDFIMDLDGKYVHQPTKYNMQISKEEPIHQIDILDPKILNVDEPKERETFRKTIHETNESPKAWVNSWHHQGIRFWKKRMEDYAKNKLKVVATAPTGMQDHSHVIEMMVGTGDQNFWLSTQWHPEADYACNTASLKAIEIFDGIMNIRNKS